jgi:hypothetical protein
MIYFELVFSSEINLYKKWIGYMNKNTVANVNWDEMSLDYVNLIFNSIFK